ncbi:N-acetyltransferase [Oceanobacillus piezotolerans]|uniref:N-acetyltransferase n=1 Tax=Oceanobacillus piezotolerans TaxID=2448030 RepID=A0A498DDR3_9BACI|nr:N-acetyltransferase [Oceanobacillus piezotolerans]RLL48342.1 N-acetyltransferase [Oceanobacillus piezotolerans]
MIISTYIKKDLGRNILAWVQTKLRDKDYLRLGCFADNIKLNNFYINNGFESVGLTDGHRKY